MIDFGLELDPLLCWDKSICISSCKNFVNFAKQTYFFYFTPQLFQNTHISLSIMHIYSNKIFIFTHHQQSIHTHHQPTQPPSSKTIITMHHHQPPSPQNPLIKQRIKKIKTPKPTNQTELQRWSVVARRELQQVSFEVCIDEWDLAAIAAAWQKQRWHRLLLRRLALEIISGGLLWRSVIKSEEPKIKKKRWEWEALERKRESEVKEREKKE